jgi:hypothetical protein
MITINQYNHCSDIIKTARLKIRKEIIESKQDTHYLTWYNNNWNSQNYLNADLLTDDGDLVSLSASEYTHNGKRIKIGCRFYQMLKHRSAHHSVIQQYVIPKYVDFCKKNNIKYLWYSFHPFNTRLANYAASQRRFLSTTASTKMPYYKYFKPEGLVTYKGVSQYSFLFDLEEISE